MVWGLEEIGGRLGGRLLEEKIKQIERDERLKLKSNQISWLTLTLVTYSVVVCLIRSRPGVTSIHSNFHLFFFLPPPKLSSTKPNGRKRSPP